MLCVTLAYGSSLAPIVWLVIVACVVGIGVLRYRP